MYSILGGMSSSWREKGKNAFPPSPSTPPTSPTQMAVDGILAHGVKSAIPAGMLTSYDEAGGFKQGRHGMAEAGLQKRAAELTRWGPCHQRPLSGVGRPSRMFLAGGLGGPGGQGGRVRPAPLPPGTAHTPRALRLDEPSHQCYRSRKMRAVRPTRPSPAPANPQSMGRAIAAGMTN